MKDLTVLNSFSTKAAVHERNERDMLYKGRGPESSAFHKISIIDKSHKSLIIVNRKTATAEAVSQFN